MKLGIVILAAGKGTRMGGGIPKVLQPLRDKPLLRHVLNTAQILDPQKLAVVYSDERVRYNFANEDIIWVEQHQQLGTGHAVQEALPSLWGVDDVLILYGDVPLIGSDVLEHLVETLDEIPLAILSAYVQDPTGYGRIVRKVDVIVRIVEEKDATEEERKIREINTGIMAVHYDKLATWSGCLTPNNAQGEYYITDIVEMALERYDVFGYRLFNPTQAMGVNTPEQLRVLEENYEDITRSR